ncbi:MAG: HAD family hydrolase [Candidatus Bathyarchaeota archaeon]|nr:MAG: HAD family hydrolase [Candidatus Bathyarchaeota archaeon]
MTIKAVLFDMWGTLIHADIEHPGEILQRILASRGISRSLDEIKTEWLNAEKKAKDTSLLSLFGKLPPEEYWYKWNSLILKHLGIAANAEFVKTVNSKWNNTVGFALYPETKEVLLELRRRGLKLGLISTAYTEEIHFFLERTGLKKTGFDIIVGVDAAQCMKPHPAIFKYALRKLKVRPEEAMFVGDNVEADYKGAKNVGMYALLINRTERHRQSGLRTIKNLKEILSQID